MLVGAREGVVARRVKRSSAQNAPLDYEVRFPVAARDAAADAADADAAEEHEAATTTSEVLRREQLTLKPLVVRGADGGCLRRPDAPSLTDGGSDHRFSVADTVELRRPPARADAPLEIGFAVELLDGADAGTRGHVSAVGELQGGGGAHYDVRLSVAGPARFARALRREQIADLGAERYEPATVTAVRGDAGGGDAADPFARAFGFVRLDGSSGAERRGELLQEFRADPMTQGEGVRHCAVLLRAMLCRGGVGCRRSSFLSI